VAQFRAEALRTAVLTFVLVRDGYTSVLFSGVLRIAIATVNSSPYGDSREIFSFNPLHFALTTPILYSMARSRMLFPDIHHYVARSDSLGIIPCRRKRQVSMSRKSIKFSKRQILKRTMLEASQGELEDGMAVIGELEADPVAAAAERHFEAVAEEAESEAAATASQIQMTHFEQRCRTEPRTATVLFTRVFRICVNCVPPQPSLIFLNTAFRRRRRMTRIRALAGVPPPA
jgi:hypothetical protein